MSHIHKVARPQTSEAAKPLAAKLPADVPSPNHVSSPSAAGAYLTFAPYDRPYGITIQVLNSVAITDNMQHSSDPSDKLHHLGTFPSTHSPDAMTTKSAISRLLQHIDRDSGGGEPMDLIHPSNQDYYCKAPHCVSSRGRKLLKPNIAPAPDESHANANANRFVHSPYSFDGPCTVEDALSSSATGVAAPTSVLHPPNAASDKIYEIATQCISMECSHMLTMRNGFPNPAASAYYLLPRSLELEYSLAAAIAFQDAPNAVTQPLAPLLLKSNGIPSVGMPALLYPTSPFNVRSISTSNCTSDACAKAIMPAAHESIDPSPDLRTLPTTLFPCLHPRPWKRLRAKRGFTFFVCRDCGVKWRVCNKLMGPNAVVHAASP